MQANATPLNNIRSAEPMLDWTAIDTVLLDMDGTLIDLNYDNHVWNDLVPAAFASAADIQVTEAKQQLQHHMREIHGTIRFYSFDYWSSYCGIDMTGVHNLVPHMIDYRCGARAFLNWLRDSRRPAIIATNAHRDSVDIKHRHTGICNEVDAVVSSHDYGYPKEDPEFWRQLQRHHPYDPARTLFVDDNEPVLDAAARAGIRHLLCVSLPDSDRPERHDLSYPSFNCFTDIYPQCHTPQQNRT